MPRGYYGNRGRGEQYRSRGGSYRTTWLDPARHRSVSTTPPPPLGDLVTTIGQDDCGAANFDTEARISDAEFIASYSWVGEKHPKIFIPGRPPLWTPLEGPQQLRGDSGVYFRDRNSSRFPKHPFEPAVVSVMDMMPAPTPVDVFACNHTMTNLLRYINGQGVPFRILLEVVGTTVHLIRRENSPKEQIPDIKGYGHEFPQAYTTWESDVKGSTSNHRIVKYNFGGMDLMMRFEADGYIGSSYSVGSTKKSSDLDDGNDLVGDLDRLGISGFPAATDSDRVEIEHRGSAVEQETIFDLKTRSVMYQVRDTLAEEMPRLWVSQISRFILAHHKGGLFEEIRVTEVSDRVKEWEGENQQTLRRLAGLLRRLVDEALSNRGTKLEIVRLADARLELRERLPDAGEAFSKDTRRQWEAWLGKAVGNSSPEGDGSRNDERPQITHEAAESDDGASSESGSDGDTDEGDYTACDKECGYCGKCRY